MYAMDKKMVVMLSSFGLPTKVGTPITFTLRKMEPENKYMN